MRAVGAHPSQNLYNWGSLLIQPDDGSFGGNASSTGFPLCLAHLPDAVSAWMNAVD